LEKLVDVEFHFFLLGGTFGKSYEV